MPIFNSIWNEKGITIWDGLYVTLDFRKYIIVLSSPVTGLEWPRGSQEVKVPRFRDNGTG